MDDRRRQWTRRDLLRAGRIQEALELSDADIVDFRWQWYRVGVGTQVAVMRRKMTAIPGEDWINLPSHTIAARVSLALEARGEEPLHGGLLLERCIHELERGLGLLPERQDSDGGVSEA